MTEKPSRPEEEYFARREAELLERQRETAKKAAVEAERKSHYMKCPKCGRDLHEEEFEGIQVDQCGHCHGTWFDAGEVASLLKRELGAVESLLKSIFRSVGRS